MLIIVCSEVDLPLFLASLFGQKNREELLLSAFKTMEDFRVSQKILLDRNFERMPSQNYLKFQKPPSFKSGKNIGCKY